MNFQKLFNYMQDEHNVILLDTDLYEIFNICQEIQLEESLICQNCGYKLVNIDSCKNCKNIN